MSDKQPNIVLIMSDDLGYEVIGANGGTSYATPRIDRMAQEGMRFGRLVQATSCWKWATSWHTGAGRPAHFGREKEANAKSAYHAILQGSSLECMGWSEQELALREAVCLFRVFTNAIRHPRPDCPNATSR